MRSIVKGTALILVGCAALRGATAATTPTVHVPADFATIQQAVDAVGYGGVVEVAAGEYGPFTIRNRSDLTIRGDGAAVIDGGADAAINVHGDRIVVSGFTVVSRGVGVNIDGGRDVVVENVTVSSAGSDGIRADTVMDVVITGNRVESAGGTGISVWATTSEIFGPLTVTSNTVLAAGSDGILVHNMGDGADTAISDNVVANVGGRGIRTECGMTLHVERNDISATGQAAVSVYQVGDIVTVSQNTVMDAGGAGVEIAYGRHVTLTGNRIDRSDGDGVSVLAPIDVRIDGNAVASVGGAGIRVWDSDPGEYFLQGRFEVPTTITSNTITQPGGTGIVADFALPGVIGANTVVAPGVHGVVLVGVRGMNVSDNRVTGAGSCGFRLERGARRNVFERNTALDCVQGLSTSGAPRKANRFAKSNHFGRRRGRR